MKFLRTVSTRRLLAIIAGFTSAIVAGAAIAVAAQGTGPVPRPKPLANAIHDALAAPKLSGITARISFTNHLIDSTDIQGADPILTGGTGRLWLSSHRLRLELQSDNGDAQVVVKDGSFWVYDPMSNTVYRGKLPADWGKHSGSGPTDAIPSVADIEKHLTELAQHVTVSGAIPGDVAGRPAYTVRVSPQHDGGLLGSGELAWDAIRGVPLRFAVYARGDSSPVLELKATDISYGSVPADVFKLSPPANAKVVQVSTPAAAVAAHSGTKARLHREISGTAAVARRLSFPLRAPATLVGLPRRSVSLIDGGARKAALVAYGENLGGVVVIEQPADPPKSGAPGGEHRGLNLPTVSINGATAQELDTALGTMVRFTRGGVNYIVLGSVPPAAADAAARGL
jgi:outer membrane lipoprotein-sorting protein